MILQTAKEQELSETKYKRDIERRMYPKTSEDFSILSDELETWRLKVSRTMSYQEQHIFSLSCIPAVLQLLAAGDEYVDTY